MRRILAVLVAVALVPSAPLAQNAWDLAKKGVGGATTGKLEKEINKRLLEEARKNQCSFKSGTAELEKGCDTKAKQLNGAGIQNFKFVVSGHTDTTGSAEKNKALSAERAAVMVKQLAAKGVPAGDIESVGMGSERPLVRPDDTPAKKAKNRRYEVQVKL
jgi:outer membrane protein OmpA-like peptidoglycan-associated protein